MYLKKILLLFLLFSIALTAGLSVQAISFSSTGLLGESINNPTSLDFGPNGKLYVAQQNGKIWEYVIERDEAAPGSGIYAVAGGGTTEEIDVIKDNTPNHNDDGTSNATNKRQVTGILEAGTVSSQAWSGPSR